MINGSKLLLIFIINLSILISIVKSNSICLNKNLHQVQNTKAIVSNGCSKPPGFQIEGEEDFTYCCDKHVKYNILFLLLHLFFIIIIYFI